MIQIRTSWCSRLVGFGGHKVKLHSLTPANTAEVAVLLTSLCTLVRTWRCLAQNECLNATNKTGKSYFKPPFVWFGLKWEKNTQIYIPNLLAPPAVPDVGLNLHDTGVDKSLEPDGRLDLAPSLVGLWGKDAQLESCHHITFFIAKLLDVTKNPEKRGL